MSKYVRNLILLSIYCLFAAATHGIANEASASQYLVPPVPPEGSTTASVREWLKLHSATSLMFHTLAWGAHTSIMHLLWGRGTYGSVRRSIWTGVAFVPVQNLALCLLSFGVFPPLGWEMDPFPLPERFAAHWIFVTFFLQWWAMRRWATSLPNPPLKGFSAWRAGFGYIMGISAYLPWRVYSGSGFAVPGTCCFMMIAYALLFTRNK